MRAREAILEAVRRNIPGPAVALPPLPAEGVHQLGTNIGFSEHLTNLPEVTRHESASLSSHFSRQLEAMGGRRLDVADAAGARPKIAERFPAATVVCSAVPEVPGTRRVEHVRNPHELADVDVGVVRSRLGVAEAGAVWLTQDDLVVNALGVLAQHLVVLLDPTEIVATMHDAYARLDVAASPYGVFMAGPSATGDIEGVIIHGAQGARTLTVLFCAPAPAMPSTTSSS